MEPSPPFIAKKLCNLARLSFFMIRKGFSKSKLVLDDLHFLMKRGKIMGKALNEVVVANHASLSCRSRDVHLSFVSPMEYEFSCSTSPSYQPYVPFHARKRKSRYPYTRSRTRDGTVFGAMGCRDAGDYESPLVVPKGRRVEIRETPFVLKDDDEDHRVDEAAEEFIQSFYKQLRLQKWLAVLEAADQYG
ncbi:Uncharacterized protein TCM_037215 [Theobroma cacao]|uniref:Avr9/Cf-9 rapidly elicited protein 146 n=1 Tax=Theobroma cacao TaxID=3641 RepID=A0A061GJS9_THECC|nr:Uncharacterized protein TCM_037215 [Theobroma cacao]